MRTVKTPQDRRAEFLDAARALFEERGVDGTSVADIIGKVGVAKGTFYWHFKSKEALLDALAEQHIDRFLEKIRPVLADTGRCAFEKLREVWAVHERERHAQTSLCQYFHRPENLLLHQKHRTLECRHLGPLLAGLIAQGTLEGSFATAHPDTAAEFLLLTLVAQPHPLFPLRHETPGQRCAGMREVLERVLGAAPGSLDFLLPGT